MAFMVAKSSSSDLGKGNFKQKLKIKRQFAESEPTMKSSICEETGTRSLVVINVAGKRYQTFEDTLARFPDTLLGDPAKRNHFLNPKTKEYFFDRNRSAFNGILYYYQSNGTLECPEKVSESVFTKEVLFFGLGENLLGLEDDENGLDNGEEEELPKNPWMRRIWILFEHPNSSLLAKIVAIFSVLVILISIVVFCIETLPELDPNKPESAKHRAQITMTWMVFNSICNGWFTIEYLLRLMASPSKLKFVRSSINVIDLVSILPFYLSIILDRQGGIEVLRVVRVIRVIRIFKLTRHSRGLHILGNTIHASLHELAMLALFLVIGVILFSSAVYYAESKVESRDFESIPHAFWWAVVTMTTVGYGDITPTTFIGKLVGAMCAISGVLVIALPVPVIVSNFEHYYKEEKARQARLEEREKRQSNIKFETSLFSSFQSPAHSGDEGEDTLFKKFKRIPSLVRKKSTSAHNGQANSDKEALKSPNHHTKEEKESDKNEDKRDSTRPLMMDIVDAARHNKPAENGANSETRL